MITLAIWMLLLSVFIAMLDGTLSYRHCQPGFMGRPDEWDTPIQEKIHRYFVITEFVLVAASVMLSILSKII